MENWLVQPLLVSPEPLASIMTARRRTQKQSKARSAVALLPSKTCRILFTASCGAHVSGCNQRPRQAAVPKTVATLLHRSRVFENRNLQMYFVRTCTAPSTMSFWRSWWGRLDFSMAVAAPSYMLCSCREKWIVPRGVVWIARDVKGVRLRRVARIRLRRDGCLVGARIGMRRLSRIHNCCA